MATIRYSIETSWSIYGYEGTIEIDDAELEGLPVAERDELIHDLVSEEVDNHCTWGWSLVGEES